jgi:enoyl-CoA hydratase/carnithine racemase
VLQGIDQALNEAQDRADVISVVLTGTGRAFCAGADLKYVQTQASGSGTHGFLDSVLATMSRIDRFPKPVIAAVCGYAYGGGCELAMHADIIIAGRSARFSQPEIRIGIMPGIGGTQRLVRAVGKAKAMQMALTGRPISAEEACIAGLISEVVADEQVQEHALEQARMIAAMPPLAAEQIKEVILAGMDASLEAGLALERKANALLFASRDQKEGMQAFLDKRRPAFEGR